MKIYLKEKINKIVTELFRNKSAKYLYILYIDRLSIENALDHLYNMFRQQLQEKIECTGNKKKVATIMILTKDKERTVI
jgi:hypothetical protein